MWLLFNLSININTRFQLLAAVKLVIRATPVVRIAVLPTAAANRAAAATVVVVAVVAVAIVDVEVVETADADHAAAKANVVAKVTSCLILVGTTVVVSILAAVDRVAATVKRISPTMRATIRLLKRTPLTVSIPVPSNEKN